jgi:hypothetical protein
MPIPIMLEMTRAAAGPVETDCWAGRSFTEFPETMPGRGKSGNLKLQASRLDRLCFACGNIGMPEKNWVEWLPDGFFLYVFRETSQGLLESFTIALIYENACITRYDTAHGYAHRDVLGTTKGWMKNVPCPNGMSYNEAFHLALKDLKRNYEEYYRFYIEN